MLNVGSSVIRKGGSFADPDYLYYNASIINNSFRTDQTADDPVCQYNDTRAQPLMSNASEYVLTVENFKLDGVGKNLPIFIPQIQGLPNTNINNTIYSVTFTSYCFKDVGGTDTVYVTQSTRYIQWETENREPWTPTPQNTLNQQPSTYYYLYSMDWFIKLLNNAIGMAWLDCKYNALQRGYLMGTKPPYFTYDAETKKFHLFEDSITCWGLSNEGVGPNFTTTSLAVLGNTTQTNGTAQYAPYRKPANHAGSEYAAREYSFVGMNTNLAQLIANLPTKYYGYNTTIYQTLSVLPVVNVYRMEDPNGNHTTDQAYTTAVLTGNIYYPEVVVSPTPEPSDPASITGVDNLPYVLQSLWIDNTNSLSPPYRFPKEVSMGLITYVTGIPNYSDIPESISSIGSSWSPVESIVITTSQIPVRNEYSVSAITYGTGNVGTSSSTSENFFRVLMETAANEFDTTTFRELIKYEPKTSAVSSLTNDQDGIHNLDLRMYWRHRLTNQLIPLTMPNQSSVSIRLLFKRRDVP